MIHDIVIRPGLDSLKKYVHFLSSLLVIDYTFWNKKGLDALGCQELQDEY